MTDPLQANAPAAGRSRSSYRRWSEEEKRRIVAETQEAGMSVSLVARRHNLNTNQLFQWRDKFRKKDGALTLRGFVPIKVEKAEASPADGTIVIELKCGTVIRVDRDVDGNALRAVLSAVRLQP